MSLTTVKEQKSHMQESRSECPFCSLIHDESNEYWIQSFDYGSLFLNYNQSYRGRCIYIPFEHYRSLNEIPEGHYEQFNKEILYLSKTLQKALNADLMNVAMLANKVHHAHWHLIPRYKTDSNWGAAPWPNKEKRMSIQEIEDVKDAIKAQLLMPA